MSRRINNKLTSSTLFLATCLMFLLTWKHILQAVNTLESSSVQQFQRKSHSLSFSITKTTEVSASSDKDLKKTPEMPLPLVSAQSFYRLTTVAHKRYSLSNQQQKAAPVTSEKHPTTVSNPCVPSLLLVGAQKGGTTSWHVFLKNLYHPSILVPQGLKECNHFNKFIERGQTMSDYLKAFPGVTNGDDALRGVCDQKFSQDGLPIIRAEASPNYLVHPYVAERVKRDLPEAKILVMLRNPVSRTVSAFNMKWQERVCGEFAWKMPDCYRKLITAEKPLSYFINDWQTELRKTVTEEVRLLRKCYGRVGLGNVTFHNAFETCLGMNAMDSITRFRYLEDQSHVFRSVYVDQLSRWFQQFDKSSVLVWSSEEFEKRPRLHMFRMVEWLGLNTTVINESKVTSKHHRRDYIAAIPDDVEEMLSTFFKPHNIRLISFLRAHGFSDAAESLNQHIFELNETH